MNDTVWHVVTEECMRTRSCGLWATLWACATVGSDNGFVKSIYRLTKLWSQPLRVPHGIVC